MFGSPLLRVAAILLMSLTLSLAGCSSPTETKAQTAAPPPTVQVASVEQRDVTLTSEWIGSMDGYVNARIQPHVSGYLIRQNYREGSFVHNGDVLFEIDPRPFQAALDQNRAQLAQAKSQQSQAHAQSKLDDDVQARAGATAAVAAAEASVAADQSAVAAAQAAVEQGELNLS